MNLTNPEYLSAIFMAGGYGTRLKKITGDLIPKPLVKIDNKPLLKHSVEPFLNDSQRIIIFLSFMAQSIINYFGVDNNFEYAVQDKPSGIIGEIQDVINSKQVHGNVAIVEGDSIRLNLNVSQLYQYHREKAANVTIAATSGLLKNSDKYHGVEVDRKTGKILRIREPNDETENPFPMIGLAILSPLAIKTFLEIKDREGSWSVFLPILSKLGGLYANIQNVNYFNMNSPEIYEDAQRFFLLNKKPV